MIKQHGLLRHVDADGAVAAFVVDEAVVEVTEKQPGEVIERLAKRGVVARRFASVEGQADGPVDGDRLFLAVIGEDGIDLAAIALAVT